MNACKLDVWVGAIVAAGAAVALILLATAVLLGY